MLNGTQILSSILDIPVNPEPSFQVSHLERSESERFDHFLRNRTDFHQDKASTAPSQTFEPKERPAVEHAGPQTPISKDEPAPPPYAGNQHSDSRPVTPDRERQGPAAPVHDDETYSHSDEPASKVQVNPFALPLERLASDLNPTDALYSLLNTHSLDAEGSSAIDTLTELLAGLNIDSVLADITFDDGQKVIQLH